MFEADDLDQEIEFSNQLTKLIIEIIDLEKKLIKAENVIESSNKIIEAAKALKFYAYPAHGSGYIMSVEGNINDLQDAIAEYEGRLGVEQTLRKKGV